MKNEPTADLAGRSPSSMSSMTIGPFAPRSKICSHPLGYRCARIARLPNFWKAPCRTRPAASLLDVRMPGQSGIDFHRQMPEYGIHLPTIFITGHGDITMGVNAIKNGAFEFLTKPFRDQDLLDAIQQAIEKDRRRRESEARSLDLNARCGDIDARRTRRFQARCKGPPQ